MMCINLVLTVFTGTAPWFKDSVALTHYERGYNKDNLDTAIWLCEQAVEISSLFMVAMKNKHKHECDEYLRITGMPLPSTKFYYPKHNATKKLITVFERQGKILQAEHIANKIAAEGWGSDKYIELSDL
jgi:hypothetical protein